MANYTKATDFAVKDGLLSGNPAKIIKGTEIDAEFNAISTAVGTKADLASPTFTGTPAAPTANAGTNTTQLATTAFVNAERTATATLTNKTLTSPVITGANATITSGSITGITDLAVADGGTGVSSLTANNVLIGNGTSPVQFVAPGTSGNILTSNGTTWTSAEPALKIIQVKNFTSSGTYTTPSGVKQLIFFVAGATGGVATMNSYRSTSGVGGGGYSEILITSPASSYTVTIGAGGTTGAVNSNANAGGTTSIGPISVTGSGGGTLSTGSSGGVGSGGSFNATGGAGGDSAGQFRGAGGGGAGGGRHGNGFAGGAGRAANGGSGGGGGGTGGAGGTSGSNTVGGAGGIGTNLVAAGTINYTPYLPVPNTSQGISFGVGEDGSTGQSYGGSGGNGANSLPASGAYDLPLPEGRGGRGGIGGEISIGGDQVNGASGSAGRVIIWEIY